MTQPDELKAVIEGIPGSTLSAKLRPLWSEIERKIEEGVLHEDIVQALNQNGVEVSLETFRKNLYRNRQRTKAKGVSPVPVKPKPRTTEKADGNSLSVQVEPAEEEETTGTPSLEDILDPKKRDKLGDSYLTRTKPMFKRPGSKQP